MSIFLLFLVCAIFLFRKVGVNSFNVFSVMFIGNLAIYQLTVLFELNSNNLQNIVKIIIWLIRFFSMISIGLIFYLSTITGLNGLSYLKSKLNIKLFIFTILSIITFVVFELRIEMPFSFMSDNYGTSFFYKIILKRIAVLLFTMCFIIYTFIKYIFPLKVTKNSYEKGMVKIFNTRFKGLLFTFLFNIIICFSPLYHNWLILSMLFIATISFMQFLINVAKFSTLSYEDMYPGGGYQKRKKKNKIIHAKSNEIVNKIIETMNKDKLYLNSTFSLNKLSSHIKLPSHVVSSIINDEIGKSFVQLINSYRIEDAKRLLEERNRNISIFCIAMEVGYNSVSTFNRAFKKIEGITPSEYQKNIDVLYNP